MVTGTHESRQAETPPGSCLSTYVEFVGIASPFPAFQPRITILGGNQHPGHEIVLAWE